MPALPIDIYAHSSRLLDSLKKYYVKEAGMSSCRPCPRHRPNHLNLSIPMSANTNSSTSRPTALGRDMSCYRVWPVTAGTDHSEPTPCPIHLIYDGNAPTCTTSTSLK